MSTRLKKELSPEDFLTRAERVKQIKIPTSSENLIIVSPNNEALGFKFNCYSEQYLKSIIEKNYFDATVKQANTICENAWRQKKREEEMDYSKGLKNILYFAVFISIISFILLLIRIYSSGDESLLYIAIAFISIAAILTVGVVVKSVYSKPNFMILEETIIRNLNEFLKKENSNEIYKPRRLEWKVESNFYWLELHINKKAIELID